MFLYLAMLDLEEDRSKFELLYYVYNSLMYRVAGRMPGTALPRIAQFSPPCETGRNLV